MKYHVVKQSEGITYVSNHEFDSMLQANKQAMHLWETSDDDKAKFIVCDDMELLVLIGDREQL